MSWDGERPIGIDGADDRFRMGIVKRCRTCSEWVKCPCGEYGYCKIGEVFTDDDEGDEECWTA